MTVRLTPEESNATFVNEICTVSKVSRTMELGNGENPRGGERYAWDTRSKYSLNLPMELAASASLRKCAAAWGYVMMPQCGKE